MIALLPVTPADAEALAALHAEVLAEAWSRASFEGLLQQPGVTGWQVQEDGKPLAFLLLRRAAEEAEILTLGTAPAHRRQGYARYLLDLALQVLAEEGCARVYLELRAGNDAARQLYASCGFHLTGQRPRYYPDDEDALVMRRVF